MSLKLHNIDPVYSSDSKILILGSFPSVKSRESQFFYAHPQNRFWKVLTALYAPDGGVELDTVDKKREFLLMNKIAVWDVIQSCEITGSSDSSIKNVKVNDLKRILSAANIKAIFSNGATSYNLYMKYCADKLGRPSLKLPSTSPANAAYSLERLIEAWSAIKDYCQ
mgnify:CR=1 FL=1